MRNKFFLRFYDQSKTQVAKHMDEFLKRFPSCIKYTIGPVTRSVNYFIPKNSWQVEVYFSTEEDMVAVKNNEEAQKWYTSCAYKGKGGKFKLQSPKSLVYNHGAKNEKQ